MSDKDKKELRAVLQHIEDALEKNWGGYGDFQKLQEKILQLRMILEADDGKKAGKGTGTATMPSASCL